MITHQEHFGRLFYQDKKTGYWISTDYPRIRAHRWVWISLHGKIPIGYHIHHKNENKSDNRIENIELIEASRHISHHYTEENRERSRLLCEKIRPLTKAWHASEEGLAWHKAHGILTWINKEPIKIICKVCQKVAETKMYHQEFCSNACKSKWRRNSGIDDVEKVCGRCGIKFMSNKYAKNKYCSKDCGIRLRAIFKS